MISTMLFMLDKKDNKYKSLDNHVDSDEECEDKISNSSYSSIIADQIVQKCSHQWSIVRLSDDGLLYHLLLEGTACGQPEVGKVEYYFYCLLSDPDTILFF